MPSRNVSKIEVAAGRLVDTTGFSIEPLVFTVNASRAGVAGAAAKFALNVSSSVFPAA